MYKTLQLLKHCCCANVEYNALEVFRQSSQDRTYSVLELNTLRTVCFHNSRINDHVSVVRNTAEMQPTEAVCREQTCCWVNHVFNTGKPRGSIWVDSSYGDSRTPQLPAGYPDPFQRVTIQSPVVLRHFYYIFSGLKIWPQ